MEERHLHYGVNTRGESAFTGNFRRVNHVEARFFLIQYGLHFLRQPRPDFISTVRRIEQENTAGLQALCHLVFINKL